MRDGSEKDVFTRETNNKPWVLGAEQRVMCGGGTDGGRSRESRRCSEAAGGRSVHEEETSLANGSSGDELVSLTTLGGGDETGGAEVRVEQRSWGATDAGGRVG